MRFEVPQFIDVEDKIFGPFTFKQFVYIVGAGGIVVLLATLLPLFFAIVLGTPIALLGLGLAFYKINDRPLVHTIESAVAYLTRSRLYLWKKVDKPVSEATQVTTAAPLVSVPGTSTSRLSDIARELDIEASRKPPQPVG